MNRKNNKLYAVVNKRVELLGMQNFQLCTRFNLSFAKIYFVKFCAVREAYKKILSSNNVNTFFKMLRLLSNDVDTKRVEFVIQLKGNERMFFISLKKRNAD